MLQLGKSMTAFQTVWGEAEMAPVWVTSCGFVLKCRVALRLHSRLGHPKISLHFKMLAPGILAECSTIRQGRVFSLKGYGNAVGRYNVTARTLPIWPKSCKLSRCMSEQNNCLQHQVDFSHFHYLAILSSNVQYFEIGSFQVNCDTFWVESIKVALICFQQVDLRDQAWLPEGRPSQCTWGISTRSWGCNRDLKFCIKGYLTMRKPMVVFLGGQDQVDVPQLHLLSHAPYHSASLAIWLRRCTCGTPTCPWPLYCGLATS